MALADNRAAGFQMAQQVFGQAQQQVNLQQQHDFMMQKMAGIQGLDPADIEALLSGDAKARGLAMSRIVQKPNGLDAIQAVSQFMTANAQMNKGGNTNMPAMAMQALADAIAKGQPIPPEYANMPVPTDALPGLMALRGQALSGGVRQNVANLNANVTEQGNLMEYLLGLAKNMEDIRGRLGDQPGKNREVSGAASEAFAKSVLEMLGNPEWPAELDRAVAATVRLFADRAYSAAMQDAQASGQAFDESYVQGQLYRTLNQLGVRPGAKEKDLRNAITKMRELMGQALPTQTEQIQPLPQATPGATPGNVTLGAPTPSAPMKQVGPSFQDPQTASNYSLFNNRALDAQRNIERRKGELAASGPFSRPAASIQADLDAQTKRLGSATASRDSLLAATGQNVPQNQGAALEKLKATFLPDIVKTAQSGKVIMPVEFEKQLRAMGMNNAQIKALVLEMLQKK